MSTTSARDWRDWVPEGALALLVLVFALAEASLNDADQWPVVIGLTLAVLLARRASGAALAIVWVVGALHVVLSLPVLTIEAAVAVVAFGCARWGRLATVILSGLSIPAAVGVAALLLIQDPYGFFGRIRVLRQLVDSADYYGAGAGAVLVGAAAVAALVLLAPWLAGLAVRATMRARTSSVRQEEAEQDAARAVRETEQAREIARLREEQARLARDVHDVVGHSLAVILAQAESAQYVEDDQKLKETMATIATSARSSLQDVRQVLTTTRDQPVVVRSGGLDSLVDGVRSSGHEVVSTEIGHPQPLPPELEVVAYRVLQEMLTNAIKHGRRDTPVLCERHWEGELRIEVRNVIRSDELTQPIQLATVGPGGLGAEVGTGEPDGQGVEGMRRRLTAVGGRLDVRRREEPTGATFTATAWLPVRGTS
ncbi:sensor histidine kinase [Nocardioides sp.]|uniref:sensor histidine kinase n=1 Tax=Nocardioides sp. TaxID=35761 RepID=UPI002CA9029A|nr:histidine kinase [Nocardioides sp.]HXH79984.1 histidine kinase [Nocardioides sp.]